MSLNDKNILEFGKAHIGLIDTFKINTSKKLDKQTAIKILNKKYFLNSNWVEGSKLDIEFKTIEDFLFSKGIPKEAIRLCLGEMVVSFIQGCEQSSLLKDFKIEVFLTIYPKLQIASLFFNINVDGLNVDDIIFIRQTLMDRNTVYLKEQSIFKETVIYEFENKIQFTDILNLIMKSIIKSFKHRRLLLNYTFKTIFTRGFSNIKTISRVNIFDEYFKQMYRFKSSVIEIGSIKGFSIEQTLNDDFFDIYSKELYGLITMDEGWRFVPKDVTMKAIQKRWGTREFTSVIPFSFGALLFNLKNLNIHKDYLNFQNNSREKLDLERLDYFNLEYSVAGLDHGLLFTLENANVLRLLIDENLINDYFSRKFTFKKIIKNRKKMIETINYITINNIEAIDNLENLILEKYYIYQYVEKVRERLDLAENDTIISYEKKTNRAVIMLTLVGLLFTLINQKEWIIKIGRQILNVLHNIFNGM